MYAYVDETGNTGANLFDEAQPVFMTAALMCKRDFDLVYKRRVQALAIKVECDVLHANELGIEKIDSIAKDLQIMFSRSQSRFFLSRVDKKYLAATKFFDAIFDSGLNLAVSGPHTMSGCFALSWCSNLRRFLMRKWRGYFGRA